MVYCNIWGNQNTVGKYAKRINTASTFNGSLRELQPDKKESVRLNNLDKSALALIYLSGCQNGFISTVTEDLKVQVRQR